MFEAILALLTSGLNFLDDKLKTKYIDEMIDIKQQYYDEQNKPDADWALLDNLEFRMCNLTLGVAADLNLANAKAKSSQAGAS